MEWSLVNFNCPDMSNTKIDSSKNPLFGNQFFFRLMTAAKSMRNSIKTLLARLYKDIRIYLKDRSTRPQPVIIQLQSVRIDRTDLEELIQIMEDGDPSNKVWIISNRKSFASIEELRAIQGDKLNEIKLDNPSHLLTIEIARNSSKTRIIHYPFDAKAQAIVYKVKNWLHDKQSNWLNIFNVNYSLIAFILFMMLLSKASPVYDEYPDQENTIIFHCLSGLFILSSVYLVLSCGKHYGKFTSISLKSKDRNLSWWNKNGSAFLIAIVSTSIGAIAGSIVTYLLSM